MNASRMSLRVKIPTRRVRSTTGRAPKRSRRIILTASVRSSSLPRESTLSVITCSTSNLGEVDFRQLDARNVSSRLFRRRRRGTAQVSIGDDTHQSPVNHDRKLIDSIALDQTAGMGNGVLRLNRMYA